MGKHAVAVRGDCRSEDEVIMRQATKCPRTISIMKNVCVQEVTIADYFYLPSAQIISTAARTPTPTMPCQTIVWPRIHSNSYFFLPVRLVGPSPDVSQVTKLCTGLERAREAFSRCDPDLAPTAPCPSSVPHWRDASKQWACPTMLPMGRRQGVVGKALKSGTAVSCSDNEKCRCCASQGKRQKGPGEKVSSYF
ncbi:hypothetical protein XELAEV_18036942mg [Xenopus laevis]|uniref:Uncharacterized protein n=1 Tax=Xenopus laevis TaxID=8355 RepID=A0A974CBM1_XENLA|nr:hypothetical protein XELAEV_18036942mg [Xenopus laevis]